MVPGWAEAFHEGDLRASVFGFAADAVVNSVANWVLGLYGAKHRKRSKLQHASTYNAEGS